MASVAGQFRQIALRVCDALDAAEASAAAADSYPVVMGGLDEAGLQDVLAVGAALRSETDMLLAAGAGVVAKLSDRELGYSGLASRKGHRSPVTMIQSITGSSRTEAARQVRLGEAMGEADAARRLAEIASTDSETETNAPDDSTSTSSPTVPTAPPVEVPWFEPVTKAVAEHVLTPDGAAAIIRGMGDPCEHCDTETMRAGVADLLAHVAQLTMDLAGTALAGTINADQLSKLARQTRDRIDPVGVSERFQKHYEARTWRFSRTETGQRAAWVVFDDESAMWIDHVVAAGMRPRRGGPRFVDKAEAARAEALKNDPRSNDQLMFDLLMDAMRTGVLADPAAAFGTRQPGLRVITTKENLTTRDEHGHLTGPGFLEDTGDTIAPAVLERILCDTGTREITVNDDGNPLDVGREQRLFTAKQKIALAYRDGGCMDPLCDLHTSYTEAHHIDHWAADHGRTDIADGVLLCTNSHLRVHNQGWKITRDTNNIYWMIPPPNIDPNQTPIRMRPKATWRHESLLKDVDSAANESASSPSGDTHHASGDDRPSPRGHQPPSNSLRRSRSSQPRSSSSERNRFSERRPSGSV